MLRRITLLAAVVALLLTGCGSTPPAALSAVPAQQPPAPYVLSATEAAFAAQAHRIAPKIVGTDERLASRAANTCSSLSEPHSKAVDVAVERFSSDSYSVTRAQAEKLVEAARTTVCVGK
jgi:type IV pilus biogenesis protein CpaD/CtpE